MKQDYSEAGKWLRKAAMQGFANTQNNIGYAYAKGLGAKLHCSGA